VESLLDQMNRAGDDINRLETALANARRHYLHVGGETERQCQQVAKGLKRNIRQSSLYYHKKVRRVRLTAAQRSVFSLCGTCGSGKFNPRFRCFGSFMVVHGWAC
jgi:ABC-type glutathione transport system ATPase component